MNPVLDSCFVVRQPSFAQCHAATICEAGDRLLAAFFAGTREGEPDVGIWLAANRGGSWTDPQEVVTGRLVTGARLSCWNPVLFQAPDGPTLLFYKVGPDPASWWGLLTQSRDSGDTWGKPLQLPEGIWGPIKNKPILLADGTLLCPTSGEASGWQVYLQSSGDLGRSWDTIGPLNDATTIAAIQPTILQFPSGRLLLLCRTRLGFISSCWSGDSGRTWSTMALTHLPNPNSGIDACMLRDGRALLVYNHAGMIAGHWGGPRSPLNIAVSEDGYDWSAAVALETEPGEYSYPSVIESADGMVHVVYTWQRTNVRHVILDPAQLDPAPIRSDIWPNHTLSVVSGWTDQPY